MLIFFFFQAEDGIRDVAVTGVQTCALPIYTGAITFGSNWCYFSQIAEVVKKNEFVSDTSWMKEESDIDIALHLEAESVYGK